MKTFVSLGKDCCVSWWLAKQRLAPWGRFFDSIVSQSALDIVKILTSTDDLFLLDFILDKGKNDHNHRTIIDTKFNLFSIHDLDHEKDLKDIYNPFFLLKNELANNLREVVKTRPNIVLIRTNHRKEPLENSIALYDAIKSIRTEPFELVIAQRKDFSKYNLPDLTFIDDDSWIWSKKKNAWIGNENLWIKTFAKNFIKIC